MSIERDDRVLVGKKKQHEATVISLDAGGYSVKFENGQRAWYPAELVHPNPQLPIGDEDNA